MYIIIYTFVTYVVYNYIWTRCNYRTRLLTDSLTVVNPSRVLIFFV